TTTPLPVLEEARKFSIGTLTRTVSPTANGELVDVVGVRVAVGVREGVLVAEGAGAAVFTTYSEAIQPEPLPGIVTGTQVNPPATVAEPVTVPVSPCTNTTAT